MANERPNVLFIAVDDLRPNLGCYGDRTALSPHIDSLAAEGVVFNRAYCQQAVCNPSRASVMTGLRPDTIRVWDLKAHFRDAVPDVVTLPQQFKADGYHTQCVGKIYHDPQAAQDPDSWSVPETLAVTGACHGKYVLAENIAAYKQWGKAAATECVDVPDTAYIDGRVAESAIAILNTIHQKPFFLAVGFRRPHLPFSAPKQYWDLYRREDIPMPKNPFRPIDCPDIALHQWLELRGYTDIPDVGPLEETKAQELIHGYYAAMSYTDAQIGKVLRQLDALGLSDNTVVVLWGDHGWHLGEHDLWGKTTNFELDTRAPLVMRVPWLARRGVTRNELVEFVDIYPTLCDLCGVEQPDNLEGMSLRPLLTSAANETPQQWKDAAFSQFPRYPGAPGQRKNGPERDVMGYSIRVERYRYTAWIDKTSGRTVAAELYDYQVDPFETVNIVDRPDHAQLVSMLAEKLQAGWRGALLR
jgi:iduronate 2-sulfatase